jgi:hypothetical protein
MGTGDFRMRFGKFKGHKVRELDDSYLAWLCKLELREPLASTVRSEMRRRAAGAIQPADDDRHDEIMQALNRINAAIDKLAQQMNRDNPHEPLSQV